MVREDDGRWSLMVSSLSLSRMVWVSAPVKRPALPQPKHSASPPEDRAVRFWAAALSLFRGVLTLCRFVLGYVVVRCSLRCLLRLEKRKSFCFAFVNPTAYSQSSSFCCSLNASVISDGEPWSSRRSRKHACMRSRSKRCLWCSMGLCGIGPLLSACGPSTGCLFQEFTLNTSWLWRGSVCCSASCPIRCSISNAGWAVQF